MFGFGFGCRGTAENACNKRVARVENQIIGRLCNRLGTSVLQVSRVVCTAEGAGVVFYEFGLFGNGARSC